MKKEFVIFVVTLGGSHAKEFETITSRRLFPFLILLICNDKLSFQMNVDLFGCCEMSKPTRLIVLVFFSFVVVFCGSDRMFL